MSNSRFVLASQVVDSQIGFVIWLQGECPLWLAEGMTVFHWMGGLWFYMLSLPLIFWGLDKSLGRSLTVAVLLAAWTNGWLKTLFDQPRPFEVSTVVRGLIEETGGGMPSGHAMLSLLFWGLIALSIRKIWVFIGTGALVLLIGVSRVVHGLHFAGDVLVGWALGGAGIFAVVHLAGRCSALLAACTFKLGIAIIVAVAAMLYAIWPMSQATAVHSPTALGVTVLGLLVGAGVGLLMEHRYLSFEIRPGKWIGTIRYLAGVTIFVALAVLLKLASKQVAPSSDAAQAVLRFTRYAVLGVSLSGGLPWLFLQLGWLMKPESVRGV